jgi:hypothetical protein
MTKTLKEVFSEENIHLDDGKFIQLKNGKAGFGLELIGIKDNKLILVGHYNWQVYEIDYNSIENKGKLLGVRLADVKENPEILLEDAKFMTVKEIEQALGHKVIVSKY